MNRRRRHARRLAMVVGIAAAATSACDAPGPAHRNPRPVRLVRPAVQPLSAMALLGRAIFYDSALSASGRRSCASCHRLENAYAGPRDTTSVGPTAVAGARGILRAVPSLRYAHRAPSFGVGPEVSDLDSVVSPPRSTPTGSRDAKIAGAARPEAMVARGGLFWDGRANTLQDQAMGPLFNADEMANRDVASVSATLRAAAYAPQFVTLFGTAIFAEPARLVDEAMFAVARYQIEDSSFHPYASVYDAYLEGKASLSEPEWRGLQAFEDPRRGNCAACHPNGPRADGLPPMFTDYEYEALGVPRNPASVGEDLGACGPLRADLRDQPQYCGLFRTPSLRNTATRSTFFHNGVYHRLEDVLAFYAFRDTRPERIYPARADGGVDTFNDLPPRYRGNVDTVDAPFDRKRGQPPPLSDQDMNDIIAYLRTLTDLPAGRR